MGNEPLGLCQCGCGAKTGLASSTNARLGLVKGQPVRFRRGHSKRQYAHDATCLVDGCPRSPEGKGLCHSHFEWSRRHKGQVPAGAILKTDEARFMAKVKILPSGHWIWTGATASEGRYGAATLNGKVQPAHRVSWQLFVGPIPDGLELDHKCRVTLCVAPSLEHLEPATHRVNVIRGNAPSAINAAKTVCIHDHEFTGTQPSGRLCLVCRRENNRERTRRYRERLKATS